MPPRRPTPPPPPRDSEMSAFTVLAIVVVILLVSVIGYFAWRFYHQPQAGDRGAPIPATQPGTPPATSTEPSTVPPAVPLPPAHSGPVQSTPGARGPDWHAFGGVPRTSQPVTLLQRKGYMLGYSEDRRNPLFVCYRVTDTGAAAVGPRSPFRPDPQVGVQVTPNDYTGSGFDRGHMAPNHVVAKCYGAEAQDETFLMTNITPQRPALNQKVWEGLERLEADVYPKRYGAVWVIDGPVFGDSPATIGTHKVQVPVSFYKILVETKSGTPHTLSVVMPQTVVEADRNNLQKFLTPIRDIEAKTGIVFFPDLPQDQRDRLETAPVKMW